MNLLPIRTRWFVGLGLVGLGFSYFTPVIAAYTAPENSDPEWMVTAALLGVSLFSLASGAYFLKQLAKAPFGPEISAKVKASNHARCAAGLAVVPTVYGLLDAVYTGRNHMVWFLGIAMVSGLWFWDLCGKALRGWQRPAEGQ